MDHLFFTNNRQALLTMTGARLIVVAGNGLVQRSNDAAYRFEQDANFWYLTGIEAPNWRVIIQPDKTSLVVPDVDDIHQVFDGSLSPDDARAISGADDVISFQQGEALMLRLSKETDTLYTIAGDPHKDHYDFSLNPAPVHHYDAMVALFKSVIDCRKDLATLRAIKQPSEIAAIRSAIDLTIDAFNDVNQNFQKYRYEYEIEADFSHRFRYNGATGHAYDPIVASGGQACTLHYTDNQLPLIQNELVLIDIGARLHGYAADITRTYACGVPTDRQIVVHQAVETAHHQIIALLGPGVNVADYMAQVDVIMKEALDSLGLLHSPADYRRYFPHSVSHGLGIDVHDSLGGPATFQEGMVLTVEPGIYIPEESIGVRIEDDILITASGNENLSARLPTSL